MNLASVSLPNKLGLWVSKAVLVHLGFNTIDWVA